MPQRHGLLIYRTDIEFAAFRHGLAGVDDQIMECLSDLGAVHVSAPQVGGNMEFHDNIGAAEGELGGTFNQPGDVDGFLLGGNRLWRR